MPPNKSKLLIITLILLTIIGIATVFLILRVTKYGSTKHDYDEFINTTSSANIYPIQYPDLIKTNNNSFYQIDDVTETTKNIISTTNSTMTTMSSESELLKSNICRSRLDNLLKIRCPSKNEEHIENNDYLTSITKLTIFYNILHYDINLQISRKDENVIEGSSKIFMKINQKTDKIILHADRQIADIIADGITVYQCTSGNQICIKSVKRNIDKQLLIITLSEVVNVDELLIVDIKHFESVIPYNQGLFRDFRDNNWMIGTLFEKTGAKNVFPCIDEKENRATLNLCLDHPKNVISKSNMPNINTTELTELTKTCFETTPAIPTHQYGFVMFDNMHLVIDNSTNNVEVYIGKHLKHSNLDWIFTEIDTVFKKMTELTGKPFSSKKLTVVSSFIDMEATHSYGLIVLKETWFEYPKYKVTYINLVRQVIGQWISGVLTICSNDYPLFCAQEGLSTFLEWTITSEFKSINLTTKSRYDEARQLILSTDDERKLRIGLNSINSFNECSERAAIIFYIIEEYSGKEIFQKFLKALFSTYSDKKCASIEEVGQTLKYATDSDVSRDIFLSYAKSKDYPIIRVKHLSDGHLTLTQESINLNNTSKFTLPIDVLDNTLRNSQYVISHTPIQVHKPAKFIVVDPQIIGYQRTIYNIEGYTNIMNCMKNDKDCPITQLKLKNIFSDMCWGLMQNHLDNESSRIQNWHLLFKQLIQNGSQYFNEICNCCMNSRTHSVKCKWTWKDKCSRLFLANKS